MDKIENLKIPVGVFKKVCAQSPICFFSGKGHLLKTKGLNRSVAEGSSRNNIENAKNSSKS